VKKKEGRGETEGEKNHSRRTNETILFPFLSLLHSSPWRAPRCVVSSLVCLSRACFRARARRWSHQRRERATARERWLSRSFLAPRSFSPSSCCASVGFFSLSFSSRSPPLNALELLSPCRALLLPTGYCACAFRLERRETGQGASLKSKSNATLSSAADIALARCRTTMEAFPLRSSPALFALSLSLSNRARREGSHSRPCDGECARIRIPSQRKAETPRINSACHSPAFEKKKKPLLKPIALQLLLRPPRGPPLTPLNKTQHKNSSPPSSSSAWPRPPRPSPPPPRPPSR